MQRKLKLAVFNKQCRHKEVLPFKSHRRVLCIRTRPGVVNEYFPNCLWSRTNRVGQGG